jgi:hypothetical protein
MDSAQIRGDQSATHARHQYDQLASKTISEAIKEAEKMPAIFTEALVIGYQDPQRAHDHLHSHFYMARIMDLNFLFLKKICKYATNLIQRDLTPRKIEPPFWVRFKGISKPAEAQSLSVEIDQLLNTIRAAHAPTAAISAASSSI